MFPKNIQFSATPLLLQQAVDGIQEPKGRLRRRKSKELAFKEKILQIPTEQLQKWKMKPAMLRILPVLATEKSNVILREKVLTIAIASMQNIDMSTHRRLIPLLWEDDDFRMAINARFVKKPPSKGWLGKYYKAFRADDPVHEMVRMLPADAALNQLHSHMQMHTANPIFQAVCDSYSQYASFQSLKGWTWNELLDWLQSGYSRSLRWGALCYLINEYGSEDIPLEHIVYQTDMFDLLRIGLDISTQNDRSHLNSVHQQWFSCLIWDKTLSNRCPSLIHQMWKPWLSNIDGIEIHRPSGWICVLLRNHVCIWSMTNSHPRIQIIDRSVFRQKLVSKLRQPTPFLLRNIASIEVDSSDPLGIRNWMLENGYQSGVK